MGRESEVAGSCFGQYVVGRCYKLGCGGAEQDYAEAVRLFSLAAAQGFANAQNFLGNMLERGQGVAQDTAEAIRWYCLAAAQGEVFALQRLDALESKSRKRVKRSA